jgi:hypothetical protein
VTNGVAEVAGDSFLFEEHGTMEVKGLGSMPTCLLVGRKQADNIARAAEPA